MSEEINKNCRGKKTESIWGSESRNVWRDKQKLSGKENRKYLRKWE